MHGPANIEKDLRGKNVLISTDFYYFGSRARPLPDYLRRIVHQSQGHKSNANDPYVEQFVRWVRTVAPATGQLYGWPDYIVDWEAASVCGGCIIRALDEEDC